MRDGWRRGVLADLVTLDVQRIRVEANEQYPLVGVLGFGRGLLHRPAVTSDTTKYRELNTVRPGQLIYSKLKAFEGAITVVSMDEQLAFASSEFPTYRCRDTVLPDYLHLLTQQPSMWAALAAQSKGVGGRRERLNPQDLLTVQVSYPSLSKQRRIVDLIRAVDAASRAAEEGVRAIVAARGPVIGHLLTHDEEWPQRSLGEVGTFIRGRRFTKSEYVESGLGCIHYGQLHTSLGPVTTSALTFLPEEDADRLRLACTGDVVIAATSENLADLARATAWLGEERVAVHDDCYIYRHDLDPRFATQLFASPSFQTQKEKFAAGVKVTRISGANLAKIKLPIPPMETQALIAEALASLDDQLQACQAQRERLRVVRASLLTALLTGEHEIPESYDELLAG